MGSARIKDRITGNENGDPRSAGKTSTHSGNVCV
jgi:hypothetical protein